jgi:FtsP/CotA-like multicopper oxidase with cupredoxin domain
VRFTRREFIKTTAVAGGGLVLYGGFASEKAWAFYQSSGLGLTLFAQALRGVGPGGIPVALPDSFTRAGAQHYSFSINQFGDQLHPALDETTLWGYSPAVALNEGAYPTRHLGGIVIAQKGVPVQMTFTNNLPNQHILPVDASPFFEDIKHGVARTSTHLHGGFVPWISDGGPMSWFHKDSYGPSTPLSIYQLLNPALVPGQAEYFYPNNQSARMVWYHDHAHDTTRLNAYAGIASAYIIRDSFEGGLRNQGLPDYVENGGREIPVVIQDKVFVNSANIFQLDPTWPVYCPNATGSLWYKHVYDPADLAKKASASALPDPSIVPEFFCDTMLANGTVFPEATVEARRYRFRVLNACNSRFLNLQMYVDDGSPNGITLDNKGNPTNIAARNEAAANSVGKPTSNFLVLGTEGGFLPNPAVVPCNIPFNGTTAGGSLLLAPAERVDLLFDFSAHVGQKIILYTDAPAPFPDGDPGTDYFPGWNVKRNPVNGTTLPGQGPNTRIVMRFKVVPATSVDPPLSISKATDLTAGNEHLPVPPGVTALPPGVPVRQLTLNEDFDDLGRLIQRLGTTVPKFYLDAATETPRAGSTEVWQIFNLTGDTHPIHFHLVNVQIISRQGKTGPPVAPPRYESGWKDTVRMNPNEITTVIMRFNLPTVPFSVPSSPRLGGNEYVWHCHILEHEEHDMMRPLIVM